MIETFESLVEKHQPLLISIVNRIHKRLPRFILYEDVMSCGQVGLAQAARTYQPQPGAKFATYAYYRISGAVYDGIARMNWTSRAEYRKYKAMQMGNEAVEARSEGSDCDDPEANAKWLYDSVDNLSVVFTFSAGAEENSIETQLVGNDDNPMEAAESNELTALLKQALATLPAEEEKLIRLAYFEGLSLAEASKQLGKSRSWGCRTHAKILKTLGAQLMGSNVEA